MQHAVKCSIRSVKTAKFMMIMIEGMIS